MCIQIRATLPLLCLTVLAAACATGQQGAAADGPVGDSGTDAAGGPDLSRPPDSDGPPDGARDVHLLVPVPDTGPAPPDGPTSCPDPYEPNESCAEAKSLGLVSEGSSWVSETAAAHPGADVDWYTAIGDEVADFCIPPASQCFTFTVRLDVPAGRTLELCVRPDSCSDSPTCVDNTATPGPTQIEATYTVSGTCGANDDTYARIEVRSLDTTGGCAPYTISFNYDEC